MAAGTFILFLTWGGHYSFGVFLLPLTSSLDASRGAVSALISIRGLFSGSFSILFGALADKYGPKRIIILGVVLTGLAWVMSARSTRLWELYLYFSLLGGLGMGAIYVPVLSVVSRWFNRRRALALGILLCSFGVSQTLLPPVFSRLTERFGWEAVFGVVGLSILAGGMPAALLLRRDPRESGLSPDGGAADAAADRDYQEREKDSWSLRETTGSRAFWQLFIIYFSCSFCFQIVIFHIVARAVDAGIAAAAAAWVVSFAGGASVAGRLGLGAAVARLGHRKTLMVSVLVQIPPMVLFAVAGEARAFYLLASVFGFAYGAVSPLVPSTVAAFFGPRNIGAILGVITLAYTLGAAVGPVTAGFIFDATGSYTLTFATAGTILAGNFVLCVFLREPGRSRAVDGR